MKKKIAVLFPGIGYTCDKPLLYYTGKLAVARGYKLVKVEYGNFPSGIKENKEKMEEAFRCGLEQAEKILQDICWEEYEDILFVSKSIGTVISSAFARRHQLSAKNILFTPLQQTFLFADGNGIVFHGTADPWADTKDITALLSMCHFAPSAEFIISILLVSPSFTVMYVSLSITSGRIGA